MLTPEHPPTLTLVNDPENITGLVKDVDARLRGWHITRPDRQAISQSLRADLLAAHADGRDPRELLGADLDDFVQRVVQDGGYATTTHRPLRLAVRSTLVAVPVIAISYLLMVELVLPVASTFFGSRLGLPQVGVIGGWVGVGVVGVAAALAALWMVLRGRPGASQTLRAAAVTLVVGAIVAVAGNVMVLEAFSRISTATIALQVLAVVVPLAGAFAMARWWGLQRTGLLTRS